MALELVAAPEHGCKVWDTVGEALSRGELPDFQLQYQLRPYFSAVVEGGESDLSAMVMEDGRLGGYVLANAKDDGIGYFGRPLHFNVNRLSKRSDAIEKLLFDHYHGLCAEAECILEIVAEQSLGAALPAVAREALHRGATLVPHYRAVVDLTRGEAEIRRDVRKSYRSLINWGRKTLETTIVGRDNAKAEIFDEFRTFHARVAGRTTRSRASWDAMLDSIRAGRAELIMGRYKDRLVSSTFVNFNRDYASYSTGVYERANFDKPIGHWPVFLSIMNARERGCACFDLGEVYVGREKDPKKADIAFFKKGFCDRVVFQAIYQLRPC